WDAHAPLPRPQARDRLSDDPDLVVLVDGLGDGDRDELAGPAFDLRDVVDLERLDALAEVAAVAPDVELVAHVQGRPFELHLRGPRPRPVVDDLPDALLRHGRPLRVPGSSVCRYAAFKRRMATSQAFCSE